MEHTADTYDAAALPDIGQRCACVSRGDDNEVHNGISPTQRLTQNPEKRLVLPIRQRRTLNDAPVLNSEERNVPRPVRAI